MIIDILSDLHLDFYFNNKKPLSRSAVKSIFEPIFLDNQKRKCGDVLIVAGDIGHYNKQNIKILKIFQEEYYKHIICVLGNHDYYLISANQRKYYDLNSFNRANEMKELINNEDGLYCLDGNVIEIDGVKFGGAMGWYSDAYIKAYYLKEPHSTLAINQIWQNFSNDSKLIYGLKNFDDLYEEEYKKLKTVYKNCDVMVTHINPAYKHRHISKAYYFQKSNAFYTFNGYPLLENGTMKYWIFGHTHDVIEYEEYGVKCICNPMGYPNESYNSKDLVSIKSIEIDKK
jgi:DNA repair exonuclease SbcCD nuclease subunit